MDTESIKHWERLRVGSLEFNRARVTRRRKAELIEDATEVRRTLVKLGWNPQLMAEVELGRMPWPNDPNWHKSLAVWLGVTLSESE